jgi:Ni/Fe-hydrogenase subunit HybB-like protein
MWQKASWGLIAVGTLVLAAWGLWEFLKADEIPLFVRAASGAIGVGLVVMIGIVLKDRLKQARTDEFKEVER